MQQNFNIYIYIYIYWVLNYAVLLSAIRSSVNIRCLDLSRCNNNVLNVSVYLGKFFISSSWRLIIKAETCCSLHYKILPRYISGRHLPTTTWYLAQKFIFMVWISNFTVSILSQNDITVNITSSTFHVPSLCVFFLTFL